VAELLPEHERDAAIEELNLAIEGSSRSTDEPISKGI